MFLISDEHLFIEHRNSTTEENREGHTKGSCWNGCEKKYKEIRVNISGKNRVDFIGDSLTRPDEHSICSMGMEMSFGNLNHLGRYERNGEEEIFGILKIIGSKNIQNSPSEHRTKYGPAHRNECSFEGK
jgi:hypothetical protein